MVYFSATTRVYLLCAAVEASSILKKCVQMCVVIHAYFYVVFCVSKTEGFSDIPAVISTHHR